MLSTIRRSGVSVAGTALAVSLLVGCGGGGQPSVASDRAATTVTANHTVDTESGDSGPDDTAVVNGTAISEPGDTDHDSRSWDPDWPDPAALAAGTAGLRAVSEVEHLQVFETPAGVELLTLADRTEFGTPTVVGLRTGEIRHATDATGEWVEWVEVLVPVRPNDLTGWVRLGDVRVEPVRAAIHVELSSRTLTLFEDGEITGMWAVAIGREDRPTPTGRYFVTDKLATEDPTGVYGPYAIGISAFSEVLHDFIGGVGQVGVHGTSSPGTIGQPVSSGCIRLPNDVIAVLVDRVPIGTPVLIT